MSGDFVDQVMEQWRDEQLKNRIAKLQIETGLPGLDPLREVRRRRDEETRVTDPETGGQKGSKPERFDLIPAGPLRTLARVYGKGAEKYEDRNWERGYDWSLSFAAMQRHLWAFWSGEDLDPETGLPHLAHAAWHTFTLLEFMERHPAKDNRPRGARGEDDAE